MSQNIKYIAPQTKRALIEYSKGALIETLRGLPCGNRLTDKQIMSLEDKYEYELDSVTTFEEMQEVTNEYVKQLRTFAENTDIGNSYWQQTEEDILKLQEALNEKFDVAFEYQARAENEVEQIMQKAIENMKTITTEKDKQKSPMVSQIEKQIEEAGGNPIAMIINGQEVIVTQETIVNSKTNKPEVVYMCRSPKATELLAIGIDDIAQIGYDGWALCLTIDEHNAMFPEVARISEEFVAKYGTKEQEKSPFADDVAASSTNLEEIARLEDDVVSTGTNLDDGSSVAGGTVTYDGTSTSAGTNLDGASSVDGGTRTSGISTSAGTNLDNVSSVGLRIVEKDGQKYAVTKEAEYDEYGHLIVSGEIRTLEACNPKKLQKGFVSLNQGTYNMVLTLDEYKEMVIAMDHQQKHSHNREMDK